ncbi:hypothetical protein Goari_001587, partial [Gossypium aridum]|nr:hypothetical protein [Gossypium aridum]
VLAANVLQSADGATYKVGDSTGWRVPTNIDFYEDWADDRVFFVGDVLVFNFTTGKHNVAVVTEAAYEACNTTDTITIMCNGPARITLNRTGDFYFICAVPGHCSAGQKVRVKVKNGNGHAAAPAPGPMPTLPRLELQVLLLRAPLRLELRAPARVELQVLLPRPTQLLSLLLLSPLSCTCPLP